ncbi:MAG: sodium/proton-translocating pyrophosphatase, partial [Rubripirellula sp.]
MSGYRSGIASFFMAILFSTVVYANSPPQEADSSTVPISSDVAMDLPSNDSSPGDASGRDLPLIAYVIPLLGIAGLIYTYVRSAWVAKQDEGSERMSGIARNITEGAMSFLRAEYSILAI